MRVLFSSQNFDGFGGTETYIVAVASAVQKHGHEVAIYSPRRGAMAEHARGLGVPVLARHQIRADIDLAIANDAATAAEMAADLPDAVRLFVAHSAQFVLQWPPLQAGTSHAVVVLNDRVGKMVEARAWHAPILRLRQPIELDRFWNLGSVRRTPKVALVNSNYVSGERARMLEAAVTGAGLELRWLGLANPTAGPEALIAEADAVIGVGRSAMEGMAAGRPALIHGVSGGDGWVTAGRYPGMESDGFSGGARDVVFDTAALTEELRAWSAELGEVGRDLMTQHHSVDAHARELIAYAVQHTGTEAVPGDALDEIAHLVRLQYRAQSDAHNALQELGRMREAVTSAELARAEADRRTAELETANASLVHHLESTRAHEATLLEAVQEADALRESTRVRLALAAGARLDRARALLARRQSGAP